MAGRPTIYSPEKLALAKQYAEKWQELGDSVPCQEGLADHMGVGLTTIKTWVADTEDEEKDEFRAIFESIKTKQGRRLINNGLNGDFNSVITKLMLGKHDYSDKQEVTGKDGQPLQIETKVTDLDKQVAERYIIEKTTKGV